VFPLKGFRYDIFTVDRKGVLTRSGRTLLLHLSSVNELDPTGGPRVVNALGELMQLLSA